MDAREYFDAMRDDGDIVGAACYDERGECIGRGTAGIIDGEERIAVMLTDCGDSRDTGIAAGAVVKLSAHPEAEYRIIGSPAYVPGHPYHG